jgi:hypothetical protein
MCNLNYTPTTLGVYKVENLYLEVREQIRLNTTGLAASTIFLNRWDVTVGWVGQEVSKIMIQPHEIHLHKKFPSFEAQARH